MKKYKTSSNAIRLLFQSVLQNIQMSLQIPIHKIELPSRRKKQKVKTLHTVKIRGFFYLFHG